jgi:hypothetical protein
MHDGRFMRYHKPSLRTYAMLVAPEVPRRHDGAIAICVDCQRLMWLAGSYLHVLVRELERTAFRAKMIETLFLQRMRRLGIGDTAVWIRDEAAVRAAKKLADKRGWSLLIKRPHGRLEIMRTA